MQLLSALLSDVSYARAQNPVMITAVETNMPTSEAIATRFDVRFGSGLSYRYEVTAYDGIKGASVMFGRPVGETVCITYQADEWYIGDHAVAVGHLLRLGKVHYIKVRDWKEAVWCLVYFEDNEHIQTDWFPY